MPTFRITYRARLARPPEDIVADRADTESGGTQVVLRRVVAVAGQPRETVLRRLPAADVADIETV